MFKNLGNKINVNGALKPLNPNKAGLFEGSFFWVGWEGGSIWQFDLSPVHISRKTYLISIQLYTIVKLSI